MLFNSLEFALFFPVVTILYFALPYNWRWLHLLLASCLFYMAFVPVYILILAFTIVIDYFAGIFLEAYRGRFRGLLLVCSLVANVGVLAIFKYYSFLADNLAALMHTGGIEAHFPALRILLPIGLSFHTFQAMSYTIEVYRGHQKAERHFGIYALYVMFYPQLVAGPIERPQNLLHQFREHHDFDYARATHGMWMMAVGLFKKIVIADQLAPQVNRVFGDAGGYHGLAIAAAVISFAFQIYYDFSGYSDIALGSAQVMGFRLMRNFDTPYFSTSITEFWRRWHISLSTWFRDYVYLPLGGSRVSTLRMCGNIMVVFLVSGLWHGANWTYVIWGAIHGTMIVCERFEQKFRQWLSGTDRPANRTWTFLAWLRTFVLVCIAWVFFRAHNAAEAWEMLCRMITGLPGDLHQLFARGYAAGFEPRLTALKLLALGGVLWLEYLDRKESLWLRIGKWRLAPRYAVYYLLIYATLYVGLYQTEQQFIYFQF